MTLYNSLIYSNFICELIIRNPFNSLFRDISQKPLEPLYNGEKAYEY